MFFSSVKYKSYLKSLFYKFKLNLKVLMKIKITKFIDSSKTKFGNALNVPQNCN